MVFNSPNPTCQNDCRFSTQGFSTTTAMYFDPIYDKKGNNLNPDGNITSGTIACSICNRQWVAKTQYGETLYKEIE